MEYNSMIQVKELDMEMTEVLNDEWELVIGADGSGSVFSSPFKKINDLDSSAFSNGSGSVFGSPFKKINDLDSSTVSKLMLAIETSMARSLRF
jgi:hypothetical protein